MGKFKNPRVTFVCEESIRQALEERASVEHRTLSKLVELLVKEGLDRSSDAGEQSKSSPNPEPLLESLLRNDPLNDVEIANLSQKYRISTSILIRLRDRLFPDADSVLKKTSTLKTGF